MKILFPTDYSDNARNAFHFASQLAKRMNGSITLMHNYKMPIAESNSTMDQLTHSVQEMKFTQMSQLQSFVKDFKVHATSLPIDQIEFKYMVGEGDPVENITKLLENQSFDLIVMGTKGKTNEKSEEMGSVTSNTIEKSSIPVLAIPEQAEYKDISKIMFAEDYDNSDEDALSLLRTLSELFDAELKIVHLAEAKDNFNKERNSNFNKIKHHILRKVPNVEFKVVHGYDAIKSLDNYIVDAQIDIISMVLRKKQEKNLGKSLVREMALSSRIPLLVFQE